MRPTAHDVEITWHPRSRDIDGSVWRSVFGPLKQGLSWFKALEAGNDGRFAYWFGLIRDRGAIIGIVPAFAFDVPLELVLPAWIRMPLALCARGPFSRLGHCRTFFIGNVAGEEGTIGLGMGVRLDDIAPAIHDASMAKAHQLGASLVVWKDFAQPDMSALDRLMTSRSVFRIPSYPGTEISVVKAGYDAFLAIQKASRRHKIKRKLARGNANLRVHATAVKEPHPDEMNKLFGLFQQTYARGATKFENLTQDFFREIAGSEESMFVILRHADSQEPVAFMLLLKLGARIINQFVGIDYSLGTQTFLSFRLFAAAYDWAALQGASTICSGQTGYAAKLDLGHRLRPLWNYCHHANAGVNRILTLLTRFVRWENFDPALRVHLDAHRSDYESREPAAL